MAYVQDTKFYKIIGGFGAKIQNLFKNISIYGRYVGCQNSVLRIYLSIY